MILFQKKQFFLIHSSNISLKVFNIITKNIPNSIFSKLDYNFFVSIVKKKIINIYLVKNKKNIASVITTVSVKNYNILKKFILFYILLNPIKIISNFNFFLSLIQRDSNIIDKKYEKNYLHLLHLVIYKKQFWSESINNKDKILNFFFKKILKNNNASIFYLCYETSNLRAHKFYKRNKFKIYKKNKKIIFIKKKFKND